ncbi:MAG: hypothetical protein WBM21_02725 [Christensenellales bacterium]|jgi:hypothetical protein
MPVKIHKRDFEMVGKLFGKPYKAVNAAAPAVQENNLLSFAETGMIY